MKHKSRLSILILALLTTIVLPGSAPIQRSSPDASQRTYAATFSILPPKDVISPLATLQSTSEEESNQIPHHPLGGQAGGQRISYRQLATLIANANRQYGTYSAERIASGVSWLSPFAQTNLPVELLADGQFVWGPNVGDFDIRSFLQARDSALQAYSDDIELWARYTSVNPKILLTVLELRYGLVNALPPDHDPDAVRANIENTSLNMAIAFYEHLHTWGSRRLPWDLKALATNPPLIFADGSIIQLTSEQASGSFAVAAAVANATEFDTWIQEMFDLGPDGFHGVLGGMFPEVDPLDASNDIDPSTPPPDNLFQFPFPLGATWRFGGPHSWAGDNTPPFSSMDFHEGGATCSAPPGLYTVAAAGGTAYRPWGYTCWLEIDHGNDWTTSYYHMQNTIDPQGVSLYQNSSLGTIACEVCAGGWASGPHVHWTLKYNGAYVSLEGVKVSGWTIHVGPTAYNSGYIERDGVTLNPWSSVVNDYHLYYPRTDTSLRFYGNGVNDIDRVKIKLDAPARPVDVGGGDFTIEWWMKALPGENTSPDCSPGEENWIYGNIILDRDVFGDGDHGDFGVSMANGRLAFGIHNGSSGNTVCGTTNLADGFWHHIAVTRTESGGMLRIFVDGQLDAEGSGPTGDISYHDGRSTSYSNDPFLVIGAEKHDAGPSYPSFSGWIDEMRVSSIQRYSAPFTPPAAPYGTDNETVALYHFDEGTGDAINDVSGYPAGPSNGVRNFGGSPGGPIWSSDTPFNPAPPPPTPTNTVTNSPTPTSTPTSSPTATPTATPTSTNTATTTPSYTPSSTPTPTDTLVAPPTFTNTPTPTASPFDTATSTPTGSQTPTPTATIADTPTSTPTFADTSTPTPTAVFGDVPYGHWAFDYINALFDAGYVAGCSAEPRLYCPDNTMDRAEAAVFVERGIKDLSFFPPDPTEQIFDDVPLSSWAAKWVTVLWEDGYTAGCSLSPPLYCPWQGNTRAEASVFFLKMLHGRDFVPAQPTVQRFADVALDTWYAKWVHAADDAGLLPPCETDPELRFCPNDWLTRDWAAYMMVQAKGGLPLP